MSESLAAAFRMMVTGTNGTAYQHLQYMPWGEPLLDQRKSGYTYNSRYTFSGKERDEETGYSYFGARHYTSALSIWLSVDPMADKYPGVSPYVYCGNNPVVLKDPDGRTWKTPEDAEKANRMREQAENGILHHIFPSPKNNVVKKLGGAVGIW